MKKRQKRQHRWWVHAILEKRRQYGTYHHLVQELQLDGEMFQQYFRLSREQFSQVLFLIGDTLIKDNRIRDVISPRERLAVCLRPVLKACGLKACIEDLWIEGLWIEGLWIEGLWIEGLKACGLKAWIEGLWIEGLD
ncbi:hypothetical protein ACOMHN_013991 [Nucella lapillus]